VEVQGKHIKTILGLFGPNARKKVIYRLDFLPQSTRRLHKDRQEKGLCALGVFNFVRFMVKANHHTNKTRLFKSISPAVIRNNF
jgi:hypothetical protein